MMGLGEIASSDLLLLGSIILGLVAMVFAVQAISRSTLWRFRKQLKQLRLRQKAYRKAARAAERARGHLQALEAKADRVKPRKIHEADATLHDLAREADEAAYEVKLMRRDLHHFIEAEFPPAKQEALIRRYLPHDEELDRYTGA